MDRWFSSWNPKFKSLSTLCHWTEILWIQFVGKPENISIDSVALPFEALRIKKGFILEIYNVEWNEYLPLNIWMLNGASKTPFNSISEANNWLYAIQKENEMRWKNWHYNSRHSHEKWRSWRVVSGIVTCVRNYEAETAAPAPRAEERSTVGGMTPRQWEQRDASGS